MLLIMVMLDHGVIGPLKRLQPHAATIARERRAAADRR